MTQMILQNHHPNTKELRTLAPGPTCPEAVPDLDADVDIARRNDLRKDLDRDLGIVPRDAAIRSSRYRRRIMMARLMREFTTVS
jgi:hypothetical protein